MGLFGRSRSDEIIEDIQNLVGAMNQTLLSLQNSLVANRGASDNNIDELNSLSEKLLGQQNKLDILCNNLSSAKQASIMVPWCDGHYFPLPMWMLSYNNAVSKFKYALKQYARNI